MYDNVREWLEQELKEHNSEGTVYIARAQRQNGWLHVPVYVGGEGDAYDKASLLQDIEDAWNDQEPRHEFQLLLVPAAR
jgi:hypothetical protein